MSDVTTAAAALKAGKYAIKAEAYDFLKDAAQLYLPAIGTLYVALAGIWGLPAAEQVVGTIVAVDMFLGVILKISSVSFAGSAKAIQGTLGATDDGNGTVILNSLQLNLKPEDLAKSDTVTVKVVPAILPPSQ